MPSLFTKEIIDKSTFKWSDLHNKHLYIHVEESFDSAYNETNTVVMAYDPITWKSYVLHTENKKGDE